MKIEKVKNPLHKGKYSLHKVKDPLPGVKYS